MSGVQHVAALIEEPDLPASSLELVPVRRGNFIFTANGLAVEGDPDYHEWAGVMTDLAVVVCGLSFLVGDLINFGEARYPEMASQIIDARHWSDETVRNYKWVAENVPMRNRMLDRGLSFKHHQIVAGLPPAQQRKWLLRCLKGDEVWSAAKLGDAITRDGDALEKGWQVLVSCTSAAQRADLVKRLERESYTCKSLTRYGKA